MKKFILFLATGFYSGYSPVMPGTAGTVMAVLLFLTASVNVYIFYSALMFIAVISVPISGQAEKIMGRKDPSSVVIDEIAGFFVTMACCPVSWGQPAGAYKYVFLGFLLFRFFDIVKPWPIKQLQDLKGGWGIVVDDIAAGIISGGILLFLRIFLK